MNTSDISTQSVSETFHQTPIAHFIIRWLIIYSYSTLCHEHKDKDYMVQQCARLFSLKKEKKLTRPN